MRTRIRLKALSNGRPRLSVFRSAKNIYAQIIDDAGGVTLAHASSLEGGKKAIAERIIYGALDQIEKKNPGKDPVEAFTMAINNVKPMVEVKSRRVGGSNYQVPVEVNPNRRLSLSIRWLVSFARERGDGKTMQEKLANEFMDASNLRGGAVKKREDVHRMAEANKAFAHYRW